MSAWFASGRIIDVILVVVALEAVGLVWWRRRTGHGLAMGDVVAQLAAGVLLMCAVRCALVGARWEWTAAFLAASGAAHVWDLVRRVARDRR